MSLLTYSAVGKGTASTVTLDKPTLSALIADSFYADNTNWEKVTIVYKSLRGVQQKIIVFNGQDAVPTSSFDPSLRARDMFKIHQAIIEDFDGGQHSVSLESIPNQDAIVSLFPSRVIAPSPSIMTVASQTSLNITDVSLVREQYRVKLYKPAQDTTSAEYRTIISVVGTLITLDAPFATAAVSGDRLRFPAKSDCEIEQQYRFLFVE
jgi:hypothetical protein